ncbi:hypothetical protein NTH50_003984 [Vibrio mimicus]
MIPKIIHYCWFGKGDMPEINKRCLDSWSRLDGYNLILWDESNAPMDDTLIKDLYKKKQWAFISDYVRLYALSQFGGVYLDTDIEIVKDLSPLLKYNAFLGMESEGKYNNAVMGAEQGHPFVIECMDFMKSKFNNGEILYSPEVVTTVLEMSSNSHLVKLFPYEFFYPYNPFREGSLSQLMLSDIKEDTYAIHHWSNSWKSNMTFFDYLKRAIKKIR